ncbi:MAG: Ig-like domain-containing protein [Ignisphaera sp.]
MPYRNINIKATLTSNGEPLAQKLISFKYRVSGSTTWIDIGTQPTDQNGVALLTFNVQVPKEYDFRADFLGDDAYEPSYAELLYQRIKASTTLELTVQ